MQVSPTLAETALAVPDADRFDVDGFLAIPNAFRPSDALAARALLDPLFERFDELPSASTHDVGSDGTPGQRRSPEIQRPSELEPRLRESALFERCHEIARALLGPGAMFAGDHAIYKPPRMGRATGWHQDYAYSAGHELPRAVHLWVPLQDTPEAAGCMRFLPGSHHAGLVAHEQLVGSAKRATLSIPAVDESKAVVCPLPLGGVTVHGPLTLHAAGNNTSADTRRAWVLHFHAPAPLVSRLRRAVSRIARRTLGG